MTEDAPWSQIAHSQAGWSTVDSELGAELTGESGAIPTLPERYEWCDVVGAGGVGTVHLVHDTWLGRDVAYKQLHLTLADSDRHRLLSWEARITARLEHPAIVPVYDAHHGEAPAFYTMRIVRGRSLASAIAQTSTYADMLVLLRSFLLVSKGVAYAHAEGVVHRDLKPANIMLGAFGEVQIVDWGLAGLVERSQVQDWHNPKGLLKSGTPGYSSPEQLAGAKPDPAADVYSLGVMLMEVVHSVEKREDALVAIADKATAENPEVRYRTALEFAADGTFPKRACGAGLSLHGRSVVRAMGTSKKAANRHPDGWPYLRPVGARSVL